MEWEGKFVRASGGGYEDWGEWFWMQKDDFQPGTYVLGAALSELSDLIPAIQQKGHS